MRAAVAGGLGGPIAVEEVPDPALGPNDVRIEVRACGICHTDQTILQGDYPSTFPAVLGHEGAGIVLEVGKQVTRLAPGDRVVSAIAPACGSCVACYRGESYLCDSFVSVAFASRLARADGTAIATPGGLGLFADQAVVHQASLVQVETDLADEQLALLGCGVTTGVGAVLNTGSVEPGSSVVVIGCGGVGQSVIQGARIAGAARIIAIDPVALKRDTAVRLGATEVLDPTEDDVGQALLALTQGRGADYVFEVVGNPDLLVQAVGMARRGGSIVIVGMPPITATVQLSPMQLLFDAKRVIGCNFGSANIHHDIPMLVSLAEAGRLDLDTLVTAKVTLDDLPGTFEALESGSAIRSVMCNDGN